MSFTQTNESSMSVCVETAIGVADMLWYLLDINQPDDFGATVTTLARQPISKIRQPLKGAPVDFDAAVGFSQDMTMESAGFWLPRFLYCEPTNQNLTLRAAVVDSTGFLIPGTVTANQAGKWQFVSTGPRSLIYATGYANAANNGLHNLTADVTTGAGQKLAFAGAVAEASPPINAVVDIAGIRAKQGDLAIVVIGSNVTLTSGNNGVTGGDQLDFTTCGLTVGQQLQVGGTVAGVQFSSGVGAFRIRTIGAASITGDKQLGTLVTDPGTGDTVDLLFGRFIRNVDVDADSDDNRFSDLTLQFEERYDDLIALGTPGYEYAPAAKPNQMTFDLRTGDLIRMKMDFPCQYVPGATSVRKTGADVPVEPLRTEAFAAAGNVLSMRTVTAGGVSSYFHNLAFTINNNCKPEKVIGTKGPLFISVGRLEVSFSGEALFTDPGIVDAVGTAETVTCDMFLRNGQGGIVVDLPSLYLDGGKRGFPIDQTITVALGGRPFLDPAQPFGTSMGVSLFPVLP